MIGYLIDCLWRCLSWYRRICLGHATLDDLLRRGHCHGRLHRDLRGLNRSQCGLLHLFSWSSLNHFLVLLRHHLLRKLIVLDHLLGHLISSGLLRWRSTSGDLLHVLLDAYLGLSSFRLADHRLIVALSGPLFLVLLVHSFDILNYKHF